MEVLYYICDVFTDKQFGGNQLAVIPDARGVSDWQMQKIAREFNFSETTFVLPGDQGYTRRVRIFTPERELPFAGHPNIGTAFVLAMTDPELHETSEFLFQEAGGDVSVRLSNWNSRMDCELMAPQPLTIGKTAPVANVAEALTIPPSGIVTRTHQPCICSTGMPVLVAELEDEDVLYGIRLDTRAFRKLETMDLGQAIYVYVKNPASNEIHVRMFAPQMGVVEDPATGSAACTLAGVLAAFDESDRKDFNFTLFQGDNMGRPSRLNARAHRKDNETIISWVSGQSVMVSQGTLFLEASS